MTEPLKRFKDVGASARQTAVQSQAAGRYGTTCSHRTATAAASISPPWLFLMFLFFYRRPVGRMQSDAGALVDPLEALRVLHSHEEFLSQVLK